MVNEKSGLYNGEVKVRETPSLFWRPTADQKTERRLGCETPEPWR